MRKPNGIILAFDRSNNSKGQQLVIKDFTGLRYVNDVRNLRHIIKP